MQTISDMKSLVKKEVICIPWNPYGGGKPSFTLWGHPGDWRIKLTYNKFTRLKHIIYLAFLFVHRSVHKKNKDPYSDIPEILGI